MDAEPGEGEDVAPPDPNEPEDLPSPSKADGGTSKKPKPTKDGGASSPKDAGTTPTDAGVSPKDGGTSPKDGGGPSVPTAVAYCQAKDPNDFWAGYSYTAPGFTSKSVDYCHCTGDVLSVSTGGFGAGSSIPIDLVACNSCTSTSCKGARKIAPASTLAVAACNGGGYFEGAVSGTTSTIKAVVAGYRASDGISVYFHEDDAAITSWPEPAAQGDRRLHLVLGAVNVPKRIWAELGIYENQAGAWTLVERATQVIANVATIDSTGAVPSASCYGRVAGTVVAAFKNGSLVGAFDAPLLGPAFSTP